MSSIFHMLVFEYLVIDLKQIAADPDLVQFQTTTSLFKLKAMPLPTSDGTILCYVYGHSPLLCA